MVLPSSLAPAASSAATVGADDSGGAWDFSQSGLPPPVGTPATSIRSLTANVKPLIGPAELAGTASRGPGTKAPKSAAAVAFISRPCTLAKRGKDGAGVGNEAEALLDVPDRRF